MAILLERLRQGPPAGCPYSVALSNSRVPGKSAVYRHWMFQDALLKTLDASVTTMHDMFQQSVELHQTRRCLGVRPYAAESESYGSYTWMTYGEVAERSKAFGAGLMQVHHDICACVPYGGIGLWCGNRPEWQIIDLGCMSQSLYTISLYETLGMEATEHIINQAAMTTVCTSADHLGDLGSIISRCSTLKFVIVLDDATSTVALPYRIGHLPVVSLQYVEAMGRKFPRPFLPPTPESVITINYTSGTTGLPKGVVLTHAAAVAAASCAMSIIDLCEDDRICSFLPLAHIFQRVTEAAGLWAGSSIGYYHGDIKALVDDLKALRPTNMVSVPRIYDRFAAGIRAKVLRNTDTEALSCIAAELGTTNDGSGPLALPAIPKEGVGPSNLHVQMARGLGLDACRTMVSGSAPIDPSLQRYLRHIFKNNFVQGYGLTETYAITLAQSSSDQSVGNCGGVMPAVEICLQDDLELGYTADDRPYPRGELLIRSTTLFSGYYLDPCTTAESFTRDGWFRSGDICEIDHEGRVRVIDRRKNILKLSQGEYVSPELIENMLLADLPWLSQIMVHGDSNESFLVAIIAVEPKQFLETVGASNAGLFPTDKYRVDDSPDFIGDGNVMQAAMSEIHKAQARHKSKGYERIKAVTLLKEPFSVQNGLLTPTDSLKLRRHEAARIYRNHIDQMYSRSADGSKW